MQHGVITRSQLLGHGLSWKGIRGRLRAGRLVRIHRGVYRMGPVPGSRHREMAAVLACGDDAVASHWTAAACWDLIRPTPGRQVAVSVPRDVRIDDREIRVFRVSRAHADEVTITDDLPLTAPGRTLLDLAGWGATGELERAFDRAVPGLVGPERLRNLLARYPRRRGRRRLLALVDSLGDRGFTRSDAERAFLRLVETGGLDRPETNVVVAGFEVDCLWPVHRLIVEIDGRSYHSHAGAFQADRERDAALIAAGYRVMRVTWQHIQSQPRPLLVRLASALARGEGAHDLG